MKLTKNGCVLALAAALASGVVLTPQSPAHAANFFQQLFGPSPRERERQRVLMEQRQQELMRQQQVQVAPKPLPTVSGPKYYTYKPDQLRTVSFAKLTDPVMTGSVSGMQLPSLTIDPFAEARPVLADLRLRALDEVASAMEAHYAAHPAFLWVTGSSINGKARSILSVLDRADTVGLDPADYKVEVPADGFDTNDMPARSATLMRFEMELTRAALTYALDATRGRIAADRISGYHDMPRKKVDLEAALTAMAGAPDPGAWLDARNPSDAHFAALKAELARLKAENAAEGQAPRVTIADGTFVRPGAASPEMPNIVEAIRQKASDGLKTDNAVALASYTGGEDYTPELVDLVKGFQKEHGLSPDGVIGSNTIRAMTGITSDDKIEKLVIAMEQARWLPAELPARRVFINEAAFTASYFEEGRQKLSMKVVVGQKAHQTYFFADQIETVEFNPYWGVPQSIIINEMLPKLRSDPGYLDRLGYELEQNGRSISSSAVNWNAVGSTQSFAVRQPPGDDNALGKLKILFPNSHAIYMHDTPVKSLFKKDVRAYSHGCVRLEDPQAMAAAVLGTTREDIDQRIATGQNAGVPVPQKIPVFVAYFTAWPDDAGKVHYFADVYDRDAHVAEAIAKTEAARHSES